MEQPPQRPEQDPSQELQDTDLRQSMESFGQWWNKYGNIVMIVLTVVIVAGVAYQFISSRQQQAYEDGFASLATTTSPEGLREVAISSSVPAVQSLARLRQGDLLLNEAISIDDSASGAPANSGGTGNESSESGGAAGNEAAAGSDAGNGSSPAGGGATREQQLERAAAAYRAVIDESSQPVFQINALLGLAAVAESQQQFDQARDNYENAVEMAGDVFPSLRQRAQQRLAILDELSEPVAFAPEPAQPSADSSGTGGADGLGTGGEVDFSDLVAPGQSGGADATIDLGGLTPPSNGGDTGNENGSANAGAEGSTSGPNGGEADPAASQNGEPAGNEESQDASGENSATGDTPPTNGEAAPSPPAPQPGESGAGPDSGE